MPILKASKAQCIRKMIELEAIHGRIFWIISMDDIASTCELEVESKHAHKFEQYQFNK
jgi:hypothetical protein